MITLSLTCPHCHRDTSFSLFAVSKFSSDCSFKQLSDEQQKELSMKLPQYRIKSNFCACGTCITCGRPVLFELNIDRDYMFLIKDYIEHNEIIYNGPLPEILHTWPEPYEPYSHPSIPEDLKIDFISLQNCLWHVHDSPWIVISACRTVLEHALNILGAKGNTIYNKLQDLQQKGILSSILLEWAVIIKNFGNTAIHESRGTSEEAKEIIEFIKIFFLYTFELPDRINKIKLNKGLC